MRDNLLFPGEPEGEYWWQKPNTSCFWQDQRPGCVRVLVIPAPERFQAARALYSDTYIVHDQLKLETAEFCGPDARANAEEWAAQQNAKTA